MEKTIVVQPDKVMMTADATTPASGTILPTAVGKADVEVIAVTWWAQVLIRVARTYLQSLVGFVLAVESGAAAGVGLSMPANDFVERLIVAASMAAAPAAMALLQNAIEILSRLDRSAPQMRA